jgi:hypothetical protein
VYFAHQYFIAFPRQYSDFFQYALSRAIPYARSQESSYKTIVVSNERQLYQSYMFYLFFSTFDPAVYQQLGGTKSGGYEEIHTIGTYEFRPIDWEKDKSFSHTLFLGNPWDFPVNPAATIRFDNLNGARTIVAVSI